LKSAAVAVAIDAIVLGIWAVWLVRDLRFENSTMGATEREMLLEARSQAWISAMIGRWSEIVRAAGSRRLLSRAEAGRQ
jgi:hypothetical protein